MVHEMIHLCFNCFHYYAKTAMHSVLVRKRAFTHNHRLYIKEGGSKEGDAEEAAFANIWLLFANKVTVERNLLENGHMSTLPMFWGFFVSTLGSSLIIIQILYAAHVVSLWFPHSTLQKNKLIYTIHCTKKILDVANITKIKAHVCKLIFNLQSF